MSNTEASNSEDMRSEEADSKADVEPCTNDVPCTGETTEVASLDDGSDEPLEATEQQGADSADHGDFFADLLGDGVAPDPEEMADPDPQDDRTCTAEGEFFGSDNTESMPGDNRSRLKGWKLSELARRPDPIWILPDTIPSGLTTVYGPPKSTKTFWCVEVAVCFAAGRPFHGASLGKHGRVLYVAAEGGGKAIYNRIMAVARKRRISEVDLEANLEVVEHGMDLNNPDSVDEFLKENPGHWDLLIIDTLARCMSGDENSTAEMNMAVAECDRIRRKAGGDLILVHHQGWAKARPRGASALFGALDALIRISRTADRNTVVEVEALREGAVKENNGALYRLVDGVLESVAAKPKGVDKLRERERRMLEVLEMLFDASKKVVPVKQWRSAVESVSPPILDGKSKKVRDQQWRRAVTNLTSLECIKVHGTDVMPWLPADEFKEEGVEDDE